MSLVKKGREGASDTELVAKIADLSEVPYQGNCFLLARGHHPEVKTNRGSKIISCDS
jgi:hypothetical protein